MVMSWQQLRYNITSWEHHTQVGELICGLFILVKLVWIPVLADWKKKNHERFNSLQSIGLAV